MSTFGFGSGFTVLNKKEYLENEEENQQETTTENLNIKPEESQGHHLEKPDLSETFAQELKIDSNPINHKTLEDSLKDSCVVKPDEKNILFQNSHTNGHSLKQNTITSKYEIKDIEEEEEEEEEEEDLENKKYESAYRGSRGYVANFNHLPGFSRSAHHQDYALIAPESRVWEVSPDWKNSRVCFLISKECGSNFSMYLVHVRKSGVAVFQANNNQRFIFGIHGEMKITSSMQDKNEITLNVDDYVYYPPSTEVRYTADTVSVVLVYEKALTQNKSPTKFFKGNVENLVPTNVKKEFFILRKLIPNNSEIDFNIHIMDFEPGEYLQVKEIHHNQHGLLMLQGQGIYRLADNWFPVTAGDVIWMGPYVLQWYAALGKSKTRYILYKDMSFPFE